MKLPRRQLLHLGAAALGILFIVVSSHTAASQTARSIRIIVPFPPGGAADLLTRVLADQLGFEGLKRAANVNMPFIPFPGGAPAMNALLGGHVTAVLSTYSAASEYLKAGKLRALATAARVRLDQLPDLPTVQESGYRDYEVDIWYGLVVPAKTP